MTLNYSKLLPDSDINKLFHKTTTTIFQPSFIEIGDEKTVLPAYYAEIANDIENFEVNDSDVFCMSYPKTGTTWTLEMLSQILNNVDEKLATIPGSIKVPFLESKALFDYRAIEKNHPNFVPPNFIANSIEHANNLKTNPRLLKTHLPWNLLPSQIRNRSKNPKIIYITRNSKDACVSFFHHSLFLYDFGGNLQEYCQLYLHGKVLYGSYWAHISSFVKQKSNKNILFITYEEMKADQMGVIKKVCNFLDKQLTDIQLARLVEVLKFENMKKNQKLTESVNIEIFKYKHKGEFMRKGVIGSYRDEMSQELVKNFDDWTMQNIRERNLYDFVNYDV